MPLTPFHWSILIFGLLFVNSLYIPALIISSSIMDIEPFYYIFLSPGTGSIHGFFHTYVGATIIGIVVAFILIKFRKSIDSLMSLFKLDQSKISERFIYISSLLAAYSLFF